MINHEIIEGWDAGKGVLGVHVHSLLDNSQQQCSKGRNPFDQIGYGSSGKKLSSIAKVYDPPYSISTSVYRYIKDNLADWVEEAVTIRNKN